MLHKYSKTQVLESLRPNVAWARGGSSEKVTLKKWPDDWELALQGCGIWVEEADSGEDQWNGPGLFKGLKCSQCGGAQ